MDENEFDTIDFNRRFEDEKELTKELVREQERRRLQELNIEEEQKSLTELSVTEILINTKDSWFGLIDDLLKGEFNITSFTVNNRLFYIGITIIIIVMIIYLYTLLEDDSENVKYIYIYPNGLSQVAKPL